MTPGRLSWPTNRDGVGMMKKNLGGYIQRLGKYGDDDNDEAE